MRKLKSDPVPGRGADPLSENQNTGGVEIYFVNEIITPNGEDALGVNISDGLPRDGIAIAEDGDWRTLAHELGHASGLPHIRRSYGSVEVDSADLVREDWLNGDWSGGQGPAYYPYELTQRKLIERLLMHPWDAGESHALPLDEVYGVALDGEGGLVSPVLRDVPIGISNMDRDPKHE